MHAILNSLKADPVLLLVFEAELLEAVDKALGAGFAEVLGEVVIICEEGPGALVCEEGGE